MAAADRELHIRLAEETRAGFRLGPAGELPLDLATAKVMNGPELRWMLMPVPKKAIAKSQPEPAKPAKPSSPAEPKRDRNEQPKRTKQEALTLKRLKRTPMPKQLVGCTPCDENGKPYCFAYNLGTCASASDCDNGMHRCCKKGFGKNHAFVTAHKQGS